MTDDDEEIMKMECNGNDEGSRPTCLEPHIKLFLFYFILRYIVILEYKINKFIYINIHLNVAEKTG